MTQAGFRVLSMEPIDVPFDQVAQISVERLYAHVKTLYRKNPGADGVYIQGGGWQTVRVVEMLEKDWACRSCTPPSARHGRSTNVSACGRPSRAMAGCLPNYPSGSKMP